MALWAKRIGREGFRIGGRLAESGHIARRRARNISPSSPDPVWPHSRRALDQPAEGRRRHSRGAQLERFADFDQGGPCLCRQRRDHGNLDTVISADSARRIWPVRWRRRLASRSSTSRTGAAHDAQRQPLVSAMRLFRRERTGRLDQRFPRDGAGPGCGLQAGPDKSRLRLHLEVHPLDAVPVGGRRGLHQLATPT